MRAPIHHSGDRQPVGPQALRRRRALQSGQGGWSESGAPVRGVPVSDDQLALLAHQVEEAIRAGGQALVDSHDVGLAILGPLRELDQIAYLRFASVYSSFDSLEDFEKAIAGLRNAEAAS